MDESAFELVPPALSFFPHGEREPPFVATLDSGRPGPWLLINALTHGNELCGVLAIENLLAMGVRPIHGRLTFCLANVEAFRQFDPTQPALARYLDEDFNRIWADPVLDGPWDSRERRRARELRPLYRAVDALLDLHSMQTDGPPLTLCGRCTRAQVVAASLGFPRILVADDGHAAGPRLMEYEPFVRSDGHAIALLVECGQHGRLAAVEAAIRTCLRFLAVHGAIDLTAWGESATPDTALPPPRRIEVTDAIVAEADDFVFVEDYAGVAVVETAGTVIGYDGGRPIVTPYDQCVLVLPSRRARKGQTAVRLGRQVTAFSGSSGV